MIITKKLFEVTYDDGHKCYIVDDNITKALATATTFVKDIFLCSYVQYVINIKECNNNIKLLSNETNKSKV